MSTHALQLLINITQFGDENLNYYCTHSCYSGLHGFSKKLHRVFALKIMKIYPLSMLKLLLNIKLRKLVFLSVLCNLCDETLP